MRKIMGYLFKIGVVLMLAIWAPVLKLYYFNESYFAASFLDLFLVSAGIGFLLAVVFLPLFVMGKSKSGILLACSLLVASVISSFVVPVNLDAIDGRQVQFQLRSEALWVLLGTVALFFVLSFGPRFSKTKKTKTTQANPLIGLSVQLSIAYVLIFSVYAYSNLEHKGLVFLDLLPHHGKVTPHLSTNNIIVISLDQIQGSIFHRYIEDSAHAKARDVFDGFVLYPDAAATYPNTEFSLASVYLGRRAKNASESRKDAIDMKASILSVATDAGYNVLTNQLTKRFDRVDLSSASDEGLTLFVLAEPFVHAMNLGFGINANGVLAAIVDTFGGVDVAPEVIQHHWKNDFDELAQYTNKVTVREGRPTFTFMHFLGTHQPFTYNADCSPKTAQQIAGSQNVEGAIDGITCSTSLLGDLFAKLKKLGVYDSSTIIVMSDHGNEANVNIFERDVNRYGSYFFPGSSITGPDNIKPAGSYNPLLMFKPVGSRAALTTNPAPVSLVDVAPTICSLISGCDRSWNGMSLLGSTPSDRERSFWRYFGGADRRDSDGTDKFHDGIEKWWRVERYTGPVAEGVVGVLNGFTSSSDAHIGFGDSVVFSANGNAQNLLRQGWSGGESEQRWTEEPEAKLHARIDSVQTGSVLNLRLNASAFPTKSGDPQQVKVLVNNKLVATWQVKDLDWHEASIPADLVTDGVLDIVFSMKDSTAPCEVSSSTDCRKLGISARNLVITQQGSIQ